MDQDKDKKAVRKLAFVIVIFFGSYLLFLQLVALLHLYLVKEKSIFHSVTYENAPIPQLIVCADTKMNLRQDVLNKYNMKTISIFGLNSLWTDFPWQEVSLKQFYAEAVIFPSSKIAKCQIGNYTCTDMEGPSHQWTDHLSRGFSCSALKTSIEVPYTEIVELRIVFDRNFHFSTNTIHLQDRDSAYSLYAIKNIFEEVRLAEGQSLYRQYTVEKHSFVPDETKESCIPITDVIKCQDECVERELMKAPTSCVLPWMSYPGHECNNYTQFVEMLHRESGITKLDCICQPRCLQFLYVLFDKVSDLTGTRSFYELASAIDNSDGMVTIHEEHLYSFLDLVANFGGSISVFVTFSLLWIIDKIITSSFLFLEYRIFGLFIKWKDRIVTYLVNLATLLCLAVFLQQAYSVITAASKNQVAKRVEIFNPEEAPPPSILFCSKDGNVDYLADIMDFKNGKLDKNYVEEMYSVPRTFMVKCLIGNETCMDDEGTSFSWSTIYLENEVCDTISFKNWNAAYSEKFLVEFKAGFSTLYMALYNSNDKLTYYGTYSLDIFTLGPDMIGRLSFNTESIIHMPPCSKDYITCQNGYFVNEFLKQDLCTPYQMPPSIKYRPCKNIDELAELYEWMTNSYIQLKDSICPQPCEYTKFHVRAAVDYKLALSKTLEVETQLVPFVYTKVSDEWLYNVNNVVAEIGGLLGVLTGLSFLQVGLFAFELIGIVSKKISHRFSLLTSVMNAAVYLITYGFFFHRVYLAIEYYIEEPVNVRQQVIFDQRIVLPDIIICLVGHRFTYNGVFKRLYLINPLNPSEDINLDLTPENYDYFFNYYSNGISDIMSLGDCYVFGNPCLSDEGPYHKWTIVEGTNTYCAKFEVPPVTLDLFIFDSIYFLFYTEYGMEVLLSNKGEDEHIEVQRFLGNHKSIVPGMGVAYDLQRRRIELLEHKSGNCVNKPGYSNYNCLSQCMNEYLISKIGCSYPWMPNTTKSTVCLNAADYNYKRELKHFSPYKCNCPLECSYEDNTLKTNQLYDETSTTFLEILINVPNSATIKKEVWAYPFFKFVAELGGFLSLFTGLTLYDGLNLFIQ